MLAPMREMEPPLPLSPPCAMPIAPGVDLVEDPVEGGAVWLQGMVSLTWGPDDETTRRLAAVNLVEIGAASQRQVAAGFGVNETTVWRWRQQREADGAGGLATARSGPRGPSKLTPQVVEQVVAYNAQGLSGHEIGRRLEISEGSVRRVLADRREHATEAAVSDEIDEDDVETADEATEAEGATSGEAGELELLARPEQMTDQRQAARAGLLAGAPPQVCQGGQQPSAGSLLALPALAATGLLDVFDDVYAGQADRAAFYDMRALVLTVTFGCLLGEPRAQGLSRLDPVAIGRLLGLDRAPEVKTLRRRLGELAKLQRSDVLLQALARRHLEQHPGQAGVFYIDGHVRAYHGTADLPKAHVARMRISMPAEVDTWITDARGDGLLVWTSPPGASLTGELRRATREIRALVGDHARPTIIFDRGGWSPKLFAELDQAGFNILTYRKDPPKPEPASAFTDHEVVDDRGIGHTYRLADRNVRLGYGPNNARKHFSCRQITRLCDSGHQTTIIATGTLARRNAHDPGPLAWAMFNRWRQENFFRYMRARFALDALDTYTTVGDDPSRTVPNPAKKDTARITRELKATIASGQATLGQLADEPRLADSRAELSDTLQQVEAQLADHQTAAKALPARVPVGNIRPEAARHDGEHKRLVDAIRMATYNAESSLARLLASHYRRAGNEARSLLREAFTTPADIQVIDGRMHVTLNPASAPHRTRALASLCQQLNNTETTYPGTNHTLVYAIKTPQDLA